MRGRNFEFQSYFSGSVKTTQKSVDLKSAHHQTRLLQIGKNELGGEKQLMKTGQQQDSTREPRARR